MKTSARHSDGSDHLGNNRLVTDATGTILQTNHFDPYGQSLPAGAAADSGNPYKFGGKEYDAKATSYDFGARYYTTSIPQWTTMDPLCEKYYSISPYAYCAGNPVNMVDPDGENIVFWWWVYMTAARTMEYRGSTRQIKEIGYGMQNPIKALRVGVYHDNGRNISSVSGAYAINVGKSMGYAENGFGSVQNALRHTIWQGIITSKMGASHARRIANAHEDKKVDEQQTIFTDQELADTAADNRNNLIGQTIGQKFSSPQEVVSAILKEFNLNGLWIVTTGKDGMFELKRMTISEDEYIDGLKCLFLLNDQGHAGN